MIGFLIPVVIILIIASITASVHMLVSRKIAKIRFDNCRAEFEPLFKDVQWCKMISESKIGLDDYRSSFYILANRLMSLDISVRIKKSSSDDEKLSIAHQAVYDAAYRLKLMISKNICTKEQHDRFLALMNKQKKPIDDAIVVAALLEDNKTICACFYDVIRTVYAEYLQLSEDSPLVRKTVDILIRRYLGQGQGQ